MTKSAPEREGYVRGGSGVRLYYRLEGESGPVLACQNGVGVSTFFWEPFARELSRDFRVLRWDYRGHGLSELPRNPRDTSIAACAEDCLRILDSLGAEKAVLLGHSMGSQVGFEVYRQAQDRVLALVPTLGTYGRAIETFFGTRLSLMLFAGAKMVGQRYPRAISRAMRPFLKSGLVDRAARVLGVIDPELCPEEAMRPYYDHMMRLELEHYFFLAADMQTHDASDLLPHIDVPTLVVAGENDRFCPPWLAAEMHRRIPGSELFVIPHGSHAALVEQPDLFNLRVRKFLEERVFGHAGESPQAP